MRLSLATVLLLILGFAGCKSGDNSPRPAATGTPAPATASPAAASAHVPAIDPCTLLTSDEIKAVQGEDLKSTSRSERTSANFALAQCSYQLPTASKSVVVNLTTAKDGKESPREFWRRTFVEHRAGVEERDLGEEKGARPEKIAGVGDDAYWEASGMSGALYVLKKDVVFRISVGGPGDVKSKLDKSKTLAQKALARI
jgi:hypothetical protein